MGGLKQSTQFALYCIVLHCFVTCAEVANGDWRMARFSADRTYFKEIMRSIRRGEKESIIVA